MLKNIFLVSMLFIAAPGFVFAQEQAEASVSTQTLEVYDAFTFEKEADINLPNHFQDISYQLADLGSDGQNEIIVGASEGDNPEIIIFRRDGSEIYRLPVYTYGYRGGVLVKAADMNNDGTIEFVTGTREGGGPHIKVLTKNGELLSEWFAFAADYRGGVSLAVGEVAETFPGKEVLVAKAEGEKTLLRIFSSSGELISEWYPFGDEFAGGVNMDVAPDGSILVSRAFGKSPLVRVMNRFGGLKAEVMAYYDEFQGGVYAQVVGNVNGSWDIYTAPGISGGPHIRNFSSDGRALSPGFQAFAGAFTGGILFEEGDVDGDGRLELVVAQESEATGVTKTIKSIVIDLSEQKLYRYYRGQLEKEYWISSGVPSHPTPTGEFSISRKRESTRMTWVYGPNHPDNYDLPDVPHAMTFVGPYNIHGAYWHHNFGHVMSHGCVNMSLPDAEELYAWTDLGTTVIVQN